jgi:predicted DNA-binding transcriptional regulator YafY
MRADRLLAIMLLLQRGGRMTAGDLAKRLEVSVRTIYRDLEALGAAGVPVYAEPGRNGGIRLLESYTTDLSGLSLAEAELVPLLGLSDAFAGIALGSSLRRTETKLLMALPDDQRVRAEQARRRIHVDLSRWWDHAEAVPYLPALVEAVFGGRRLRLRYKRGEDASVVQRTLDPLGLVVQGGTWYLVARAPSSEQPRIYRVSRIMHAESLAEVVEVPDDFDLVAFWIDRKEDFHMTRSGYRVKIRARPWALRALRNEYAGAVPDGQDWTEAELSFGTRGMAFERLLGLGAGVEVLEPDDLRNALADAVRDLYARYVG